MVSEGIFSLGHEEELEDENGEEANEPTDFLDAEMQQDAPSVEGVDAEKEDKPGSTRAKSTKPKNS